MADALLSVTTWSSAIAPPLGLCPGEQLVLADSAGVSRLHPPGDAVGSHSTRARSASPRLASLDRTRSLVRQWARPIAETLKHSKRDAIPIVILTVMSLVGTFGMAAFSNHPLLLIFLSARLPFLALASTRLGFFPFLVVSFIRLSLADPFHFRIGRRLGTEIGSELSPAPTRHPGARSILRFGLLGTVFMAPIGRHLMAAGASKLRVRHVIVADVLGTLVYVTLVYFLGSTVITALR